MTNREKYEKEILDIACSGSRIALNQNTMILGRCEEANCEDCYFYDYDNHYDCSDICEEWCNSEYIESPVDWSKVPVDTPILVRASEEHSWKRRYFAKYEDNRVYTWDNGANSWSKEANYSRTTSWKYAKLAEEIK